MLIRPCCLDAKLSVWGYTLIVDAKDEGAKTFYERHGLRTFEDTPQSLYLPLGA